jgi:glycosyltransferase involved in cell wall biosynthesis
MSPSSPKVSAYIPCYNNARTIERAISGILAQSVPVDDFFIVDDGSTDSSREVVKALNVRVIEMGTNQGRGAVRARAMEEASHDLVLCCDATNRLKEDFLQGALVSFSDPQVAAVLGKLVDLEVSGVVSRWRARHLFRQFEDPGPIHKNSLITWGTLMRKSAVLKVGNYNTTMRFSEDYELGRRLEDAGYQVLMDSTLIVATQVKNTLGQTMERFLRWQYRKAQRRTFRDFISAHVVALRILLPRDYRDRDFLAMLISLVTPYYMIATSNRFQGDETETK